MISTVTARYLLTATQVIDRPIITFADGRILSIDSREGTKSPPATYDFEDAMLTSGLLDIHIHGAIGCDVMDGTTASLAKIGSFLASHGTTDYLATTVTASREFTWRALDRIAAYMC